MKLFGREKREIERLNKEIERLTQELIKIEARKSAARDKMMRGIEIAKAKGTYKGRVKGSKIPDEVILKRYSNLVIEIETNPKSSLRCLAHTCGCSTTTVRKVKSILKSPPRVASRLTI